MEASTTSEMDPDHSADEDSDSTTENSRDADLSSAPDDGFGGGMDSGEMPSIQQHASSFRNPASSSSSTSSSSSSSEEPSGSSSSPLSSKSLSSMFRKLPSRIGDKGGLTPSKAKRTHKRAKSFKSILLRGSSVDVNKERNDQQQTPTPPSSSGGGSSSGLAHSHHSLTSTHHLAASKGDGVGSGSGSHKPLEELSPAVDRHQDEARGDEEDARAADQPMGGAAMDEKEDAATAPAITGTTTEDDGMSWSDFEDRYCGPDLQNDPLASDFLFPDDDVSVVSEPRTQRALVSTMPSELMVKGSKTDIGHGLEGWLRACADSFTSPWTVVRYNYAPATLDPGGATASLSTAVNMSSPSNTGRFIHSSSGTTIGHPTPSRSISITSGSTSSSSSSSTGTAIVHPTMAQRLCSPTFGSTIVHPTAPRVPIGGMVGGRSDTELLHERKLNRLSVAVPLPSSHLATAIPSLSIDKTGEDEETTLDEAVCEGRTDDDDHLRSVVDKVRAMVASSSSEAGMPNTPKEPRTAPLPTASTVPAPPYHPFTPPVATKLLVSCDRLQWQAGEAWEPLFCSAALYHLGTRRKISETFYFDYNGESVLKAIAKVTGATVESDTQANKALFTVVAPSPLIHLVVRVERLLLTELDKEQETFYYKPKHWKPRDPAKAQQELVQAIEQWGAASGGRPPPLQVLGWGALAVFAENGVLRASGRLRIDPLLPARSVVDEEALFEALAGLSSSAEKAAEKASGGRKRGEVSAGSGGSPVGGGGSAGGMGGGSKRSLSGCLHVTLQRIQDEETLPNRLDPSFHPLLPFADNPRPDVSQLIREVMSFEAQREAYTSFVNWIYVYPEGIHLAKGGPSNPNLLVEVRLKDDDDAGGGRALPLVCGRSGSGLWHEVGAASVHTHERKPRYWDELKVRLPARLTPRHHLHFTFLHVHPGHRRDSATIIGHSVVPLSTNHCVLPNSRQVVPITWARDFPAAYLSLVPAFRPRSFSQHSTTSSSISSGGGGSGNTMRSAAAATASTAKTAALALETDKQHPAFVVSTHVVSSIYPSDEHLCRFFDLVRPRVSAPSDARGQAEDQAGAGGHESAALATSRTVAAEERKVTMASWNFALDQTESDILRGLGKLDALTCVNFMPVLLNELFYLMAVHDQPKRRKEAFLAIIHLVRTIEKGSGTRVDNNALLSSYVRYMFRNPDHAPYLLYEELCHNWLLLLSRRHEAIEGFTGNRFLLDVLTKSMTLHVHSSPHLRKSKNRKTRFSQQFSSGLARLVRFLFSDRAVQSLDALSNFPILLRKLFAVMDRGLVLNMVYEYVRGMKDQHAILGKFKFLQILVDYEHYIPLNLPVIRPIESLDLGQLLDQWWRQHFLAGLLLKQIDMSRSEPPALRTQAIITLRNLLKKHEHDERYQRPAIRERIANLYFPFVVQTTEHADQLDEREKGEWLACFIHIARHCSRSLLRSWWQPDTQKRQVAFLRLLASCVTSSSEGDPSLDAWTTIFEFVIDYMQDFRKELRTPGNVLLTRVFAVLLQLMQHAPPPLLPAVYAALQSFICQFRAPLFRHASHSRLCETLSFEILRHANAPESLTRRNAASTFYVLLKNNWDEVGNIARMRVQSTVAVSRLVGGAKAGQGVDTTRLQMSLRAVGRYSERLCRVDPAESAADDDQPVSCISGGISSGISGNSFDAGVQELISRIFRLCHYSIKIADNIGDPETTADFYRRISEDYFDSPDLRVRWLENLAEFHTNHSKLEEAAQCKLHAAALVAQYLRRFKGLAIVSDADFAPISPNVSRGLRLPEAGEIDGQAAFQDQDVWSASGLTKLLKAAANLLEQAKSHELCVEVLMLLTTIYKAEKKYPELISTLEQFKAMTTTLVNANKFDVRIFPVYFRVGFYGPKAEELQGKEFIYKVPGETRLGHIQTQLKEKHAKKVGGVLDDVLILQNKPMEAGKMDPSKLYIQLGPVTPHSDPLDSTPRISPHEVNFNVNTFVLETGFSESGKNVTELAKQQKKKVVFTVSYAFPYQTSRLEVERTSELILSPLENAIELIENRVAALRAQLTQNPPRLNALQSVIQGSVVTMVNEGPLKICEVFLAPGTGDGEGQHHEPHRSVVLKERMTDFVKLCGFAIKLNKSLISSEHLPFQNMVEQKYEALREAIRVYTDV